MCDVLFIPYRDMYFWKEYGSAVRDLQFIELIAQNQRFQKITILNRPVSLYERFLNKKKKAKSYPLANVIDSTSLSLLGPLKKRAWTEYCYTSHVKDFIESYVSGKNKNKKLLVIDFTPIAKMPIIKNSRIFYWYDMIDNFTKHNVFSDKEKKLVHEKYQCVAENYNFITAVSDAALCEISKVVDKPSEVISNGVFESSIRIDKKTNTADAGTEVFDFGFTGFVTDKFDTEFVKKIAQKYRVVVYGGVYDSSIAEILKNCGVTLKGKFSYNDIPDIMKTFKIGLLPYLIEKSHDGSPLKMYEYFKANLPCITSIDYEYSNEFVVNYNSKNFSDNDIHVLLEKSGNQSISSMLPPETFLKYKIEKALESFWASIG